MFGFKYINGDPEVRSRFWNAVRFWWNCIVYAFALIGLGSAAVYIYWYFIR